MPYEAAFERDKSSNVETREKKVLTRVTCQNVRIYPPDFAQKSARSQIEYVQMSAQERLFEVWRGGRIAVQEECQDVLRPIEPILSKLHPPEQETNI